MRRTARIKTAASGIAILAWAACGAAEVRAQDVRPTETQYFTLNLCNKTPGKVWFAFVSRENPQARDWYVQGWHEVGAHGCRKLGRYPKGNIYIHAMGDRGIRWNGPDFKACVESTRFKHTHYADAKCDASLRRGFYKRTVNSEEHTFSLNPG